MAEIEMLATSRSRRTNAGNQMSKLLNNLEEADDFYKSTYGGFDDEADDNDFESAIDSDSDSIDSDFDIDENQDASNEDSDHDSKKPRSQRVVTKAYKEPSKKKFVPRSSGTSRPTRPSTSNAVVLDHTLRRKRIAAVSAARSDKPKQKRFKRDIVTLSQEQYLAEAKETELLNAKSLQRFQKWESEQQKKARVKHKRAISGPFIRLHSKLVPQEDSDHLCSTTFVSFSDTADFALFCRKNGTAHRGASLADKNFCVITGLPARYLDPLTELPYATADAFKVIRKEYRIFLQNNRMPTDI